MALPPVSFIEGRMDRAALSAEEFWSFSLEVYSRPQVADLCLHLQDEHGFDVNVLLLCLWLACDHDVTLDRPEINSLLAGVSDLNESLVWPLRRARRWSKERLAGSPGEHAQTEWRTIYAGLKALELQGERQVQQALIANLRRMGLHPIERPAADAARQSLEHLSQAISARASAAAPLADLILRALS